MARTVREEEYAARRNQILDVAQKLIYTRGYEQMAIQDILAELAISKGAFYHYFGSKQVLLEAMIERMLEQAELIIEPIVLDPHLSALAKFERYFDAVARWKSAQKEFVLALLRGWYTDDNAIVRQKVSAMGLRRVAPFLATIIRQGVAEEALRIPYTDHLGEVIMCLMQGFGDTLARLLLEVGHSEDAWRHIEDANLTYTDALERVLGATPGSLHLFDVNLLRQWVIPVEQAQSMPDLAPAEGGC
jgi:AcrR family transcriptional regulator